MWTLCFTLGVVGVVAGVNFEELCYGCIRFQGIGFAQYKYCTHFVICKFNPDGRIDERGSSIQKCPFGQFWSQRDLLCKPAAMVSCENDLCKYLPSVNGQRPGRKIKPWWVSPDACSQYWTCYGHKTDSANCCPRSTGATIYNPLLTGACVTNPECEDRCIDPKATTLSPITTTRNYCHLNMPHPYDRKKYRPKSSWSYMSCSRGEIFDDKICTCVHDPSFSHGNAIEGCKADLYLPLNNDRKDHSENEHYVDARGVNIQPFPNTHGGGAGFFAGHDKLSIIAYSNGNFGNNFAINMRLLEKRDDSVVSGPQTLITNGCDHTNAPIHVTINTVGLVTASVLINDRVEEVQVSLKEDWPKIITVAYNGNQLYLQGRYAPPKRPGTKVDRKWRNGKVPRRQCSLTLGSQTDHTANSNRNFKGMMDEVKVYLCIPESIQQYMKE